MKQIVVSTLLPAVLAGCLSGYSETPTPGELRVRRGAFTSELTISGEVEAARGVTLNVPPLPSWQTAIKWIAEDGGTLKAGEPAVELDNSALTAALESKRQALTQALQELEQQRAEWAADLEQKQLDADKAKSELDKAKLDTLLPRDLVSTKVFEDYQSAMRRTTVAFEKAVDLLMSRKTAIAAERRNLELRIEKARRDITTAETAIEALVLRAPRDGIVVIRDIPWESRKLQSGDTVFVGMAIAMLPDLDTVRVKAALPDVDDGKVAIGMPVTITLDAFPDAPFTGRITGISAVAQESRRQSLRRHFEVLVAFDRLDSARMRPGLSARVIIRRETDGTATLAPRAAIDFSNATPKAHLAGGRKKDVKLGACNAQDCVVLEGLEVGEKLAPVVGGPHA
ncbi:MAG TPA: efflux RND transporter periplasmic adaptor subunit [Thermoanaerobaculia bacterium]|jgi:multidrug resistance efflux pump|nr:efflux RND transporter periplasmic adaptor subunit [Thermoanaerobaculia bacterium]